MSDFSNAIGEHLAARKKKSEDEQSKRDKEQEQVAAFRQGFKDVLAQLKPTFQEAADSLKANGAHGVVEDGVPLRLKISSSAFFEIAPGDIGFARITVFTTRGSGGKEEQKVPVERLTKDYIQKALLNFIKETLR
jgi:hypothetical protein